MKLLLDAMMAERIGLFLTRHDITHVVDMNWQHLSNGKFLTAAESEGFEVLITKDANMPYQQNMAGRKICLIILKPVSQDFDRFSSPGSSDSAPFYQAYNLAASHEWLHPSPIQLCSCVGVKRLRSLYSRRRGSFLRSPQWV